MRGGVPRTRPRLRRVKILVTGGAGFIGSHYVRRLLGVEDVWVTVLDALTYAGNLRNLDECRGDRLAFVEGDVCDESLVDKLMAGHDAVVHFAAETHVDRSIKKSHPFVRTNVLGTQVLLSAALEAGVPRFVQVSTDEVYGSVETGSWREDQPLAPRSPYAASKAAADLLALSYHATYGLDVVVVRCSNTYGPQQFPEKLIPLFVTRFLDGRPAPLYGDGLNVRDWLHVSDCCAGIHLALSSGRSGEVYHVGGGNELTNVDLVGRLVTACGVGAELIEHVADRAGHDRRYSLNFDKARDELGYAPAVDLQQGLAETVAWYRENRWWWEPLVAGGV
jgi:dTDP-glucose 4,6-dehydratase